MRSVNPSIDAALLEVRLGAEQWRTVRHAAWRGTPLEDGRSAAAAELVARQELRGAGAGLLAFLILTLAGSIAFLGVGDGWSIALLTLGLAGTSWCAVATFLLRRSVGIHRSTADHGALTELVDGRASNLR